MSKRFLALKCLQEVLDEGSSLTDVLNVPSDKKTSDHGFIAAICYGVLRYYWQLDTIARQLLQKPLKEKDEDIHLLILMGLFELIHLSTPPHAATSETVQVCVELKKEWGKNLVNAILRNFLRSKESLLTSCETSLTATFNHPAWLGKLIQKNWPEEYENILTANNQQAPMTLRINHQQIDDTAYLEKLTQTGIAATKHSIIGITLEKPCDVDILPDFAEGAASVQDPSAQLAATLLQPKDNDIILDACAAPGGKTTHIIELAPHCKLTAVEIDKPRIAKIFDNLQRLKMTANVIHADANLVNTWWNNIPFDKILCDAPCSASGVIRRHPDIKHLRQKEDIATLAKQQFTLLNNLWKTLKIGGTLLYCTCSLFKEENDQVIARFLSLEKNAKVVDIEKNIGRNTTHGKQILPGENGMDGFYYCLLMKIS